MRIAIDYTTGIYPGAGIARYTRSLVGALAGLDHRNRYALFYAARGLPQPTPESEQADTLFNEHPNFRRVPLPFSVRQMFAIWQRLHLPLGVDRFTGRCHVVHSPDFVSPPHRRGADVITVHDLSFMVMPECAEPKLARFLGKAVPAAVRRADHIIAVSEQTKNDLVRLLDVPPEKITVAYNGVDARFKPGAGGRVLGAEDHGSQAGDPSATGTRHLTPNTYILHVGTLEPRKNLKRLVEAYGLAVRKGYIPGEVSLVLAGRKGWLFQPIMEAVERVNGSGRGKVVPVDFVHDTDLPLLYNGAAAFAYPSLYEGFGLPAAEALACGVPALVSHGGALAEVVGDAALAVDPESAEEIAQGLGKLLSDEELRARLKAEGPKQVARFTWDTAARTMLQVYREVAR